MDQIVQLLFNPNHQAPSPLVLAVLVALAVGMPPIMRYLAGKSNNDNTREKITPLPGGHAAAPPAAEKTRCLMQADLLDVLTRLASASNIRCMGVTPPFDGLDQFDYGLRKALDPYFDWQ